MQTLIKLTICQCVDHACPVHVGHDCTRPASDMLLRVDMCPDPMRATVDDGIPMCEDCAADAMESGVFVSCEDLA